jgi:putative cell wall-binding protein
MNTKVQVLVNDIEIENIFRELETKSTIPFVSITLLNDFTKMVKTCKEDMTINPYFNGNLKKLSTRNYRLLVDYKQRVTNNRKKEGVLETFNVEPPKGKHYLPNTNVVLTDNKGQNKRYLMVEYFDEIKGKTEYFDGQNSIDKSLFSKWIKYYDNNSNKQGTERNVNPITPLFTSIVSFRVNGMEYIRQN